MPGEGEQGRAGVQILQPQGARQLVQEQAGSVPGPQVQADQRGRRVPAVYQQRRHGGRRKVHMPGQQSRDLMLPQSRRYFNSFAASGIETGGSGGSVNRGPRAPGGTGAPDLLGERGPRALEGPEWGHNCTVHAGF